MRIACPLFYFLWSFSDFAAETASHFIGFHMTGILHQVYHNTRN